jgi:hypothetical protein
MPQLSDVRTPKSSGLGADIFDNYRLYDNGSLTSPRRAGVLLVLPSLRSAPHPIRNPSDQIYDATAILPCLGQKWHISTRKPLTQARTAKSSSPWTLLITLPELGREVDAASVRWVLPRTRRSWSGWSSSTSPTGPEVLRELATLSGGLRSTGEGRTGCSSCPS